MNDSKLKLDRAMRGILLCLAILLCLPFNGVHAQTKHDPFQMPLALDPWNERDAKTHQLRGVEQDLNISASKQQEVKAQLDAARQAREQLVQSLASTGHAMRRMEGDVLVLEQRLKHFELEEQKRRAFVRSKQSVYIEILAAMQRIGSNPPPVMLVSSQDALGAVRSAAMLEQIVPRLRGEAAVLAENLDQLSLLRHKIADDRQKLIIELASLSRARGQIIALLDEKKQIEAKSEAEMAEIKRRVDQMVVQSENLKDLIALLETDINAKNAQTRLKQGVKGGVGGPELAGTIKPTKDTFTNMQTPEQRLAKLKFETSRGQLLTPVAGTRLRNFGETDSSGTALRGMVMATRATTQIIAPAAGIVLYAGPFRSYGQLLILNLGSGYHMLVAGMEKIYAFPGQFVDASEPVGEMGVRSATTMAAFAASNSDTARPMIYVELRKDGQSIDPSPWWKPTNKEEVNG